MLQGRIDYLQAFELIFQDYIDITRYIEPHVTNFGTFSHRIYAVYLRACTEFESVCKDVLIVKGVNLPQNPNINHYVLVEPYVGLEKRDVAFYFWNPQRLYIEPFASWTTNNPRLQWYASYNKVKHNRAQNFTEANFRNLTFAVAGIFLIMAQSNVFSTEREWQHTVTIEEGHTHAYFPKFGLALRDRKI